MSSEMPAGDAVDGQPRLLRDASVIALGVGVGQGIVLLTSPLVTRLFDPSAFGVFAVLTALESVFVVVACLRLEMAVTLPADDGDAVDVVAAGVLSLLGVTAVLGLLALVGGSFLAEWTSTPDLDRYIWTVPAVVFFDAAGTLFSYWAVRRRRFRTVAASRIGQSAGQVGAQLALGATFGSPAGLMVGVGIGRAVSASTVVLSAVRRDSALLRRASWSGAGRALRRFRRFPLIGGPSALLNSMGLQLPALLLAGLYSPAVAGWYLLGSRMVALPSLVLGQAVSQTFHGHASVLHRSDPSALASESRSIVRRLLLIGALPTVVFLLLGPQIFGLVFGSEWEVAGEYVRILAPAYLAQFALAPLASVLAVTERNDLQLVWDVVRLALVAAALLVPSALGASATIAIVLLALASGVAYLGLLPLANIARARPHQPTHAS